MSGIQNITLSSDPSFTATVQRDGTKNVVVASKSTFTTTVQKIGDRVATSAPITVKNQIREIRSIEDIPGVNTALRVDGASLFYNANTGEYDVKSGFANVQSIYINTLFANGSAGQLGQALLTNGNNVFWGQVQFSNNATYAVLANNATFAYGKRESDLSVNFSAFSGTANFAQAANSAVYAEYALNVVLANSSVVPGTYGNNSSIPVVTVDQFGRINAISTAAVAGVNSYSYSSSNNTFTIQTGDGSVFRAAINTVKDFTVTGNLTVTGNTATLNTDNLNVKDGVIRLNDGQLTPFNDIGFIMQRYAVANSSNYNVSIAWDESVRELKFGRTSENGLDNELSFSQEWIRVDENGNANFLANTQAGNSVIAGSSMVINGVSFTERNYPGEANTALYFNGTIDCGSY